MHRRFGHSECRHQCHNHAAVRNDSRAFHARLQNTVDNFHKGFADARIESDLAFSERQRRFGVCACKPGLKGFFVLQFIRGFAFKFTEVIFGKPFHYNRFFIGINPFCRLQTPFQRTGKYGVYFRVPAVFFFQIVNLPQSRFGCIHVGMAYVLTRQISFGGGMPN